MASAKSPRLTHLALAALCVGGASAAQADAASRLFQVRLQVLSACRVAAEPATWPDGSRKLAIRCSRHTPFSINGAGTGLPTLAGTGVGMATLSASWPMHHNAAMPNDSPASAPALHVAY